MPGLLLSLLLVPSVAEAGAWTRDAGSYYAKAGADGFWATSFAQAGFDAGKDDRYLGQLYSAYGELGLAKGHPVQLAASLPLSVGTLWFVQRDQGNRAEGRATVHRMGDLKLRPQVALHPSKPVALALETKLPLYRVDSICDDNAAFKDLCPRPGDGQIDITPMVLAGAGFGSNGFAELGVGYRHRTEVFLGWDTQYAFQDSLVVETGGGAWLGKLLLMGKFDAVVAPRNDGVSAQNVRVGPSALWDIADGVALEARTQADLYAVNAAKGFGFGVGVSARR